MDDLSAMLNQIMGDPESMQQIQSLASSLGLGGNTTASQPAAPPQNNTPDLSALSALLGGLSQPAQPPPPPAPSQPAPDLSAIASLLQGLGQAPQPAPQQPTAPDLSSLSGLLSGLMGGNQTAGATPEKSGAGLPAITALLNGGSPPQQSAPSGLPNIDISTIMKLSQALSSVQTNKANIDLLLALKPRLNETRSKKIDDAIRVMQLIQFLPLIKESGLFGEMDNILSGLVGGGNSGGGLGGLLGNVGNGIGGLLGNLGRR